MTTQSPSSYYRKHGGGEKLPISLFLSSSIRYDGLSGMRTCQFIRLSALSTSKQVDSVGISLNTHTTISSTTEDVSSVVTFMIPGCASWVKDIYSDHPMKFAVRPSRSASFSND